MAGRVVEAGMASAKSVLHPRWVRVADEILRWITEVPSALLVLVEFCLLLTGVIARYALHRPLFWVDELATTLFLWLNMLGAAIALRRDEHMRLTAFVRHASAAWRAWIDVAVLVVIGAFVLQMLGPTVHFVQSESAITMPALDISAAFSVSAVLVGMILMLIILLIRLAKAASLRMFVSAVTGIDHGTVDLSCQKFHRARGVVAHHQDVRVHGVQRYGGVDQGLALAHRGRGDRHVHDVGAEPLSRDLEGGLGTRRGLEEQVDLGAAAQRRALFVDLAIELDIFLGEIEQAGNVGSRKPLDSQQVPVT